MSSAELALPSAEEERLKRLRKQMREQDARRFMDPDRDPARPEIFLLYAWQEIRVSRRAWRLITWIRGRVTPKRIQQLRHKYRRRIADDEVVRLVDLRVARLLGGAGGPPLAPPTSRRPARLHRQTLQAAAASAQTVRRRKPADTRLSKCEHRRAGKRCPFRAPWYVGYTDTRSRKRAVRKRCRRHAWDDKGLPPTAKQVIRVARTVQH